MELQGSSILEVGANAAHSLLSSNLWHRELFSGTWRIPDSRRLETNAVIIDDGCAMSEPGAGAGGISVRHYQGEGQYLKHGCGDQGFFGPILGLDAIGETMLGTIDFFLHEFHRHG